MALTNGRSTIQLPCRSHMPGAVVIGGDYQGLAIVRSLGRRGVPVIVIDDERSVSRYSRFVAAAVKVPSLRDHETTVQTLTEVADMYGLRGSVVFPTREETVAALSRHRDQLLGRYRIPTPAWEVVRWAWDKRNTYELAGQLGIPIPRTWSASSVEDLHRIDADPPFVIKPAIKEHFIYATRRKAWRADSHEELAARFAAASDIVTPAEVIVQELIPGAGDTQFAYCGFFKDGRAAAKAVVRRLRQHPADFGRASTFVQTVEHPALEEPSERFLQAIDYYGLVELEYKYDARDGQTKLLDVNARTWGYHGVAQYAGVDFPYHLFADQVGLPAPDRGRARPGVSWIRLATDMPTAAVSAARGGLDWRAYGRSLREFNVESVFSRDDPLPALAELALLPYSAVRRGL